MYFKNHVAVWASREHDWLLDKTTKSNLLFTFVALHLYVFYCSFSVQWRHLIRKNEHWLQACHCLSGQPVWFRPPPPLLPVDQCSAIKTFFMSPEPSAAVKTKGGRYNIYQENTEHLLLKITSALQATAVVSSHLLTRRMYSIWHWQQGAHWYILSPLTNKKRERIILWTPVTLRSWQLD